MAWLWWYWPLALVFIAFGLFAVPEWMALHFGGPTFSRFMATASNSHWGKVWVFVWGLLIGALLIHFNGPCVNLVGE
jgi:hypothetical protein